MHSMQKIINYMVDNCELSSKSRFVIEEVVFDILTVRNTICETSYQTHSAK